MLKSIFFENFKSWEKVDITASPITGFFGTNSSGKTSIIQFLLMLKQTKENRDRNVTIDFGGDESLANLKDFGTTIHKQNENFELNWKLSWNQQDNISISDPDQKRSEAKFKGNEISIQTSVKMRNGIPFSSGLSYEFDQAAFTLKSREKKETDFHLEFSDNNKERQFKFTRTPGRNWPLSGPVKSYAFPDEAKTYYLNSGFLGILESAYESFVDNVYHLGPLREHPKRQYNWSRTRPVDVGEVGEKTIEAILAACDSGEKQNVSYKGKLMQFDELIAYWLQRLGLIHSFRVEEIKKGSGIFTTIVKKTKQSSPTTIVDVGFGVSQVLPVLVLLHYVPKGSTVLLEQPEIHLHPAVQSGLADVIVNVARHRGVQVIIESHSEHLLRRLQRRIAEETISNSEVSLYFCSLPRDKSVITPLEINLFGEIENWPKDFFGNEIAEIAATQKAALKRKIAQQ